MGRTVKQLNGSQQILFAASPCTLHEDYSVLTLFVRVFGLELEHLDDGGEALDLHLGLLPLALRRVLGLHVPLVRRLSQSL